MQQCFVLQVLLSLNDKVVLISSVLMKLLSERDIKVLKVMIPNLSFMIVKMVKNIFLEII